MATDDWEEIYSAYEDQELADAITKLKKDIDTPYVSQQQGPFAYQKALTEMRDRLQAAIRIRERRAGRSPSVCGIPDFSKVEI